MSSIVVMTEIIKLIMRQYLLLDDVLGPKLQCFLKVKDDLS